MKEVLSETSRCVQLSVQKSFEEALADAESTQKLVLSNFSRRGGRSRKSDALQELILEIVRGHPTITRTQLLAKLKGQAGEGVVSSIDRKSDVLAGDDVNVHFFDDRANKEKIAAVSGLKDRLGRAKKSIRANR